MKDAQETAKAAGASSQAAKMALEHAKERKAKADASMKQNTESQETLTGDGLRWVEGPIFNKMMALCDADYPTFRVEYRKIRTRCCQSCLIRVLMCSGVECSVLLSKPSGGISNRRVPRHARMSISGTMRQIWKRQLAWQRRRKHRKQKSMHQQLTRASLIHTKTQTGTYLKTERCACCAVGCCLNELMLLGEEVVQHRVWFCALLSVA